jgi:hypothetical protein
MKRKEKRGRKYKMGSKRVKYKCTMGKTNGKKDMSQEKKKFYFGPKYRPLNPQIPKITK